MRPSWLAHSRGVDIVDQLDILLLLIIHSPARSHGTWYFYLFVTEILTRTLAYLVICHVINTVIILSSSWKCFNPMSWEIFRNQESGPKIVYKIPYRRARAWPSGCLKAECAREQRYLAYKVKNTSVSRAKTLWPKFCLITYLKAYIIWASIWLQPRIWTMSSLR